MAADPPAPLRTSWIVTRDATHRFARDLSIASGQFLDASVRRIEDLFNRRHLYEGRNHFVSLHPTVAEPPPARDTLDVGQASLGCMIGK